MSMIPLILVAWLALSVAAALFFGRVIALRDRHETPVPKRADWNHS